jgi:hypothetical protein
MATGFPRRKKDNDIGCNHPNKGNSGIGAATVMDQVDAEKYGFKFLEDLESVNASTGLATKMNVSKDGKFLGMFTICMQRIDPKNIGRWLSDVPFETAAGSQSKRIQIDLPCVHVKK